MGCGGPASNRPTSMLDGGAGSGPDGTVADASRNTGDAGDLGDAGQSDGAVAADADPTSRDAGAASPCDRYFDAVHSGRCSPRLPATELSRVRARFDKTCQSQLALSGTSATEAKIDACAAAIAAYGCRGTPDACNYGPGTLAPGSACNDSTQCTSTYCANAGACGVCASIVPVGQPCGGSAAVCAQGTVCDATSKTCQSVSIVNLGAGCMTPEEQCAPGLYCSVQTFQCATPGNAVGARCGGQDGCVFPLRCITPQNGACEPPGMDGGSCMLDRDCAADAGFGCTNERQCATLSWVTAGQACGGGVRCLQGSCTSAGTCPTVIPDGQPCVAGDYSKTCDTYSGCVNGSCTLVESTVCR